jgi:hypothetical protein
MSGFLLLVAILGAGSIFPPTPKNKSQQKNNETQDSSPSNWTKVHLQQRFSHFLLPPGFLPYPDQGNQNPQRFHGRIGGKQLSVYWHRPSRGFSTISRSLLRLRYSNRFLEIHSVPTFGFLAAKVERIDEETGNKYLSLHVWVDRQVWTLEIRLPGTPHPPIINGAHQILSSLKLLPKGSGTRAGNIEEMLRKREKVLGFPLPWDHKVGTYLSPHYHIYSDAPKSGTLSLQQTLEEDLAPHLCAEFGPLLPKGHRFHPLVVYLHRNRGSFVLDALDRGIARPWAEKVDGFAWGPHYSTWFDSPKAPVHFHEGTHQFVEGALGLDGGGAWFQEGLADWIEMGVRKAPIRRLARNLLRTKKTPSLKELMRTTSLQELKENEQSPISTEEGYLLSASLIAFIHKTFDQKTFLAFVRAVGILPGGDPRLIDQACNRTLGITLKELEIKWRKWGGAK